MIQDPVCYLYKGEEPKDREDYLKLKKAWIGKEASNDSENSTAKQCAEQLIERMHIKPGSVVGIDIALLYDDIHRLQNSKCILSMELCNKMISNNIKCFMYSSEADEYGLREKWYEVYKNEYKNDNQDIHIYQRSDFMQKGNYVIVDKIEQMFKKSETDDKGDQYGENVFGKEVGIIKPPEKKGNSGMAE